MCHFQHRMRVKVTWLTKSNLSHFIQGWWYYMRLEWQSLTVTLFPLPEGVTVTDWACIPIQTSTLCRCIFNLAPQVWHVSLCSVPLTLIWLISNHSESHFTIRHSVESVILPSEKRSKVYFCPSHRAKSASNRIFVTVTAWNLLIMVWESIKVSL